MQFGYALPDQINAGERTVYIFVIPVGTVNRISDIQQDQVCILFFLHLPLTIIRLVQ